MYKDITDFEELPQGWGRLYVGPLPMDTDPIKVGDTVTVKIATDIELTSRSSRSGGEHSVEFLWRLARGQGSSLATERSKTG